MSEDPDNIPPPPGGYGAGPYRAPGAPPPAPPPDDPTPPRNTGRWAAGGIGFALLAVRACLLFARLDDSSPSYDYTYTPPVIPTYDPLAGLFDSGASAFPKLPKQGGHLALGESGRLAFDDSSGAIHDGTHKLVCADYCTTQNLVVVGKKAYWISFLDEELRSVSLEPTGAVPDEPAKVAALHDPGMAIATDGKSIYLLDESVGGVDGKTAIVRVDPASGKQTKLATMDGLVLDLRVAGGRVYYAVPNDGGLELRAVPSSGGASVKLAASSEATGNVASSAVAGGYYYVAYGNFSVPEHVARVPVGGGALEVVYDATPEEELGPIAADKNGLYLAHGLASAWSISFLKAPKAEAHALADVVTAIPEAPQALAVDGTDVVYTSHDAIFRVPITHIP